MIFDLYGGGRLILQSHLVVSNDPDNPFVLRNQGIVPTCRANVSISEIKGLIDLMIVKHFFDLPEQSYVYFTALNGKPKLALHRIIIDDGREQAERTFGVGEYEGENESLPPEFVAVEEALQKIRDAAFPPFNRPCGVAPAIRFGQRQFSIERRAVCHRYRRTSLIPAALAPC